MDLHFGRGLALNSFGSNTVLLARKALLIKDLKIAELVKRFLMIFQAHDCIAMCQINCEPYAMMLMLLFLHNEIVPRYWNYYLNLLQHRLDLISRLSSQNTKQGGCCLSRIDSWIDTCWIKMRRKREIVDSELRVSKLRQPVSE